MPKKDEEARELVVRSFWNKLKKGGEERTQLALTFLAEGGEIADRRVTLSESSFYCLPENFRDFLMKKEEIK